MTNPATPTQITITLNGETRTIAVGRSSYNQDGLTCSTLYGDTPEGQTAHCFWGRFPTGNKAHLMLGEFDLVDDATGTLACNPRVRVSRYELTGTDEHGQTWRLATVLYTHNRNVGRLVGWSDKVPADMIAKWR